MASIIISTNPPINTGVGNRGGEARPIIVPPAIASTQTITTQIIVHDTQESPHPQTDDEREL